MKVKYTDILRRIFIASLTHYPRGIALPSKDNIIEVTDGEFKSLLKMKNGNSVCFEKVENKRKQNNDEVIL